MRSLAYGVVGGAGRPGPGRVVARTDAGVVDVAALADVESGPHADLLAAPSLDALLAAGRPTWQRVHGWLAERLRRPHAPYVLPHDGLELRLPFTVPDYVDFFACEQHARNAAEIARPGAGKPPPNWRHLPVGYHGHAGTVVVSGTPVPRPVGQLGEGEFGPTRELDVEVELGFVLGASEPGPVPVADALDHVFGVVLLNDWSARDVQRWETRPLGPLLGKQFATSVSAWVTPLDELAAAWVDPPARDPEPLPYLRGPDRGLDVALELAVNGTVVSRPPARDLYWTIPQLVAHLTASAPLRAGDLVGSGTVSGPAREQRGSLLELTWGGAEPITVGGVPRTWLEDGDEVVITATAPAVGGGRLSLGEVRGRVHPARVRPSLTP